MTAEAISITLAGEPKGAARVRFTIRGRPYVPSTTRSYQLDLRYRAQEVMAGRPPIAGAVAVNVVATFGVPRSWSRKKRTAALDGLLHHVSKPDADNLLRMLDAICGVVIYDDRQITQCSITKRYGAKPSFFLGILPLTSAHRCYSTPLAATHRTAAQLDSPRLNATQRNSESDQLIEGATWKKV